MRQLPYVFALSWLVVCAAAAGVAAQDVYVEQPAPAERVYLQQPVRPEPRMYVQQPAASEPRVYVMAPEPNPAVRVVRGAAPMQVVPFESPGPQVQIIEHNHAPPPLLLRDPSPSPLRYSAIGFVSGALVGLSVGYLAISGGVDEPWRPLLLASGIGALSGAGLGLGLGFLDVASDVRPAPARYVMRDAGYGTLLGGLFGATVGGLVALGSHEAKHVLVGTAIGGISGFVLGGLVGVLEGRLRTRDRLVSATLQLQSDAAGRRVVAPGLVGRF